MKRKMLLFAAALVLLFAQKMWAQLDFDPEVIWESKSPVTFNILKFSPDDRYFYTRNDEGIHKFNSENGEYMGIFIPGLIGDFGIISEYGWMFCTRAEGLSIYDMNTGEFIQNIGDSWPGGWFDVSPDKSKIVFRQQGSMWVYSLPDLEEICRYPHNGSPRFLNNSQIAMTRSDVNMGGDNWAIDVYSIEEQKIIRTLPIPHPATVGDKIFVSLDYKNLITINSTSVNFYDIETAELRKNIPFFQAYGFGFNQTQEFYIISGFSQISIYNYNNHNEAFKLNSENYRFVQFLNKDNKRLFAGRFNKIKMLRFDFDSLATGVEIKANIPVIYPNPTSDYIIIPIESELITKVIITDYTGRDFPSVYTIESGNKSDSIRLNLSSIPHGTYFVTIQSRISQKTYKLIKGE